MSVRLMGFLVTAIAGLTILYNASQSAYNQRQINEALVTTILSGGANLSHAYTFTPPFTGFEITVMAALSLGVVMLAFGGGSKA
jgi:hypothetical protein